MCGRFVLLTDLSVIVESFDIRDIACDYKPNDNISPGQRIAAVIHDGRNRLVSYRWGLIPPWAKDPSIGNRMFNARAETITEKPSFKNAFQKRRCLIPADGFFEWQKGEKGGKPFRFALKSGLPFGFAGLYETWMSPDKEPVSTCTIITTEPNELIRFVHDRMPVIVPKEMEAAWIDPANRNREGLLSMLKPYPAVEMLMSAVIENGGQDIRV
ncbi:MAG: SOS response-associated peptidase [Proteobacteria bacterium]|nr:SOS response-associated peptidase [Pseudomonadota bacterium]